VYHVIQLSRWQGADFEGDDARKQKFLALMGGKKYNAAGVAPPASTVSIRKHFVVRIRTDNQRSQGSSAIKSQSALLTDLEKQFQFGASRAAGRMGSRGLGFGL
jgi:hypothetical protein